MKTIRLNAYGIVWTVRLVVSHYVFGGSIAVGVEDWDEELQCWEPFADLTKNLDFPLPDPDTAFVKTYGENSEWAETLIRETGIAEPVRDTRGNPVIARSGYVDIPLYKFDREKLKEYTP